MRQARLHDDRIGNTGSTKETKVTQRTGTVSHTSRQIRLRVGTLAEEIRVEDTRACWTGWLLSDFRVVLADSAVRRLAVPDLLQLSQAYR